MSDFWDQVKKSAEEVQKWPAWRTQGYRLETRESAFSKAYKDQDLTIEKVVSNHYLNHQVELARKGVLKDWLLNNGNPPPSNTTLSEINQVLDEIEKQIQELRRLYPRR